FSNRKWIVRRIAKSICRADNAVGYRLIPLLSLRLGGRRLPRANLGSRRDQSKAFLRLQLQILYFRGPLKRHGRQTQGFEQASGTFQRFSGLLLRVTQRVLPRAGADLLI